MINAVACELYEALTDDPDVEALQVGARDGDAGFSGYRPDESARTVDLCPSVSSSYFFDRQAQLGSVGHGWDESSNGGRFPRRGELGGDERNRLKQ